ncbi:MAG: TldD/PmbA family protein [Acidobacteriota bacterium]
MAILTRDEAKAILTKVLGYSKAESCTAMLGGGNGGNIRYARNSVTTSGVTTELELAVESQFGKRSGVATITELDDDSLRKVAKRADDLAKLAPENPELMPILGPQTYVDVPAWSDATANIDPAFRAAAAAKSINPSRSKDLVAAGYLEDQAGFSSMMNSKGLFGYHRETSAEFSVTVRTQDGTGSGWVSRDVNDVGKLDLGVASNVAIDKAVLSREPRAIEPGKYTVILEPSAALGLLQYLIFSMDARQADEGRSFLSKPGGGTKLGEKIVDERVTLYSDPLHPDIPTAPWGGDGLPRKKINWIEKGVVKNLFYSRYWAQKNDKEPVPFPGTGIMVGGNADTAELVKSTKRGILVTRTWYIRMVDPQTILLTGLTRDGTFFIENGKIAFPIKNMRFNESPVIMLNNLEALGTPVRTDGAMVPPLKIRDFTFSSLSDAV